MSPRTKKVLAGVCILFLTLFVLFNLKMLLPFIIVAVIAAGVAVWILSRSNKRYDRKIVKSVKRGVETSRATANEVAGDLKKKYEETKKQ